VGITGLALCAVLLAQSEGTDVLCLQDGRIFDGLDLRRETEGVTISFENGEVFVPERMILEALIEGGPDFDPKTDLERDQYARGLVPFEDKWVSVKRRNQLIQKRLKKLREEIEDMRAHREWANRYTEKTKNFNFEYTVPQNIFESYRDQMEIYFQLFKKDWKVKSSREIGKLTVAFYGSPKEWNRTSGAGGGVIGYFKFFPDFELNIFYDRLDPSLTEDVMYHEANHYLQQLVDVDFKYPHWPGEALAEYYGASDWDPERKKLTTGLIQEGRLIQIQRDIAGGERMGIRELILDERAFEHYTWGWSLVHFLMNDSRYDKKFRKFFLSLAKAGDVKRTSFGIGGLRTVESDEVLAAFMKYLGVKDDEALLKMEAQWHAYIDEQLNFVTPRGLEKAAYEAKRTDRPLRAKRLYEEAIAAGSQNAMAYHRFAELLYREDEKGEAIKRWKEAIELDPLTGTFYYRLGSALTRRGKGEDEEEGQRLKALGLEIDPDLETEWTFD